VYHCGVFGPALQGPRWIHARGASGGAEFVPWLEVSALVRVRVDAWQHDERLWLHRAVPCADGAPRLDAARAFDPGRRAGRAGEPADSLRAGAPPDERAALEAGARLLAGWRPLLHRHDLLGLVSRPDEPVEQFRHRCLGALGPAIRSGGLRGDGAQAALARLAGGIESRALGAGEVEAESVQVRIAWYPADEPPTTNADDLLLVGAVRQVR
jgi:hypothetical protein